MKKKIVLVLFVLSLLLLVGCQQRGKATDMLARQQYVQQDYTQRAYASQNNVGLQAQRPSVIRERPQDLTQPVYSTDSQIRTDALVERDYLAVKPTYQREITRTTADVLLITETPPTTKPSETDYDEKGKIIGEWWENKTKDGKCKKIIYHGYEPNKENCTVEVILVDNNCDGEWDEMLVIKYGNNKKDWDEKREGTKTRKIYRKVKFEGGYKFKKVLKETKEWLNDNTLKKTKETKNKKTETIYKDTVKEERKKVKETITSKNPDGTTDYENIFKYCPDGRTIKRTIRREYKNGKVSYEEIFENNCTSKKRVKETTTYYKNGNKTNETVTEYEYGSDGKLSKTVTVEKDKRGKKVKETVTESDGSQTIFEYCPDGKTIKRTIRREYKNGKVSYEEIFENNCTSKKRVKETTTYYKNGQKTMKSEVIYDKDEHKIKELIFNYCGDNKIDKKTVITFNKDGSEDWVILKYDCKGNIIKFKEVSYDKQGNKTEGQWKSMNK